MEDLKEFSRTYFVTPGLCNARRELPVPLLVSNIIEIATEHANRLGIGFRRMTPLGTGWVLSRLSVQMSRYPRFDEHYTLTTWVEDWNRFFSVRDFAVTTPEGETLGYARTVWMVIDLTTHTNAGTTSLDFDKSLISPRPCIIDTFNKKAETTTSETNLYSFRYTDIDFYGHVNTVRYIELLLNQFPLQLYEKAHVRLLEVSFRKEARYGETVEIEKTALETSAPQYDIILRREKDTLLSARILFA